MKPLTLEETKLKEEMKNNCLKVGKYKDEKAKDKFEMLCHLEDFEVQYWELQKENEHLDWVNCHLRKTNEKLKERIAYLERSNNRRECTILEQRQEISNLEDNWNDLKKYAKEVISTDNELYGTDLLDKMQEIVQKGKRCQNE